jgi:3-hydroxyacyl-CoA dehydrogenase/enoyl-CoA hydratase/3-hydroxybutyryl-CoA epimerase
MNTCAKHWHSRIDPAGIAWLEIDTQGSPVNILSMEVMTELESTLTTLLGERISGLVVISGKPNGFIAGADISEFKRLSSSAEGRRVALQGQALFKRLDDLPVPTVAAMNGSALGGGLELALACDYRIAVASQKRCLGLPEVQLGIHPGFGGTVRSVQILGAPVALDLMLTGKQLSPDRAYSLGLVDRVVQQSELQSAAVDMIQTRPAPRRAKWMLTALDRWPLRRWVAAKARAALEKRVKVEHYPAPFAIIDLYERHGARGQAAYQDEAESIGRLLITPTCRNLVRVFYLRERLKNLASHSDGAAHVHVIGAGVMGSDIATWCVTKGLEVSLQDQTTDILDRALQRASKEFARQAHDAAEQQQMLKRLHVDLDGSRARAADVVVEAIVERLAAKQALLRELEPKLKPEAIVATNTSSITLEQMGAVLENPGRFVGLHFFNPVARLPLVEVIRSETTADATLRRAVEFVIQIGKLPLPCRSSPGFVVNRILTPYMLEALRAHREGHEIETIDAAAMAFGMPLGPIELADRVGLDVAQHVVSVLAPELKGDVQDLLAAKVAAGQLGVKTGAGFYQYIDDRPVKSSRHAAPGKDLEDRLILPMLNEAVACLDERVVEDSDLVDAGVIFGTGFAPFRGGPLEYAKQRGIGEIVTRLHQLAEQLGPRFAAHAGWNRLSL